VGDVIDEGVADELLSKRSEVARSFFEQLGRFDEPTDLAYLVALSE
jgi:hypothetical protein